MKWDKNREEKKGAKKLQRMENEKKNGKLQIAD